MPKKYKVEYFLYYMLCNIKNICVCGNIEKGKFRSDLRA